MYLRGDSMQQTSRTLVFALPALVAGAVLLATSLPVQAAHNSRCDPYPHDGIAVCGDIFTDSNPRYARALGTATFVPHASRATKCLLTVWVLLHNYQDTFRWKSPVAQVDCTLVMQLGGGIWAETETGSTASWASAWACVDLYYNHSNHSGFQRCGYSEKVGFTPN
jgi:hypothetical protein